MAVTARQLSHAVALAEQRNFARAAKKLHITQPALSRSIQALEQSLGVRLFDRHTRGVEPTVFGTLLVRRGNAILFSVVELQREIDLLGHREIGELAVGAGPLVASDQLGPALARMSLAYPRLKVQVRLDSWAALSEPMRRGEIEMFIGETAGADAQDDLVVKLLKPLRMAFFARSGHPLDKRRRVTRNDLMRYPLVAPRIPPRLVAWARGERDGNAWWGEFPEPPPTIECESFAVVKSIVAGSDAVSAAPVTVFAAEQRAGVLVDLKAQLPEIYSAGGIVCLRDRTLSPAAHALIELLLESGAPDASAARRP